MELPLTKTLQLSDYDELKPELVIVDRHFHRAREQHEHRRFEYAMALRAYAVWARGRRKTPEPRLYDVGGAGSPFQHMVPVTVIDPDQPGGQTLEQFVRLGYRADGVFCLSVLEHVKVLDPFLHSLTRLLVQGGLLFLTMDITEDGTDPATVHFAHMRERIFSPASWRSLAGELALHGFTLLDGQADWHYYGHTLYGSYSFASLAMVKRS